MVAGGLDLGRTHALPWQVELPMGNDLPSQIRAMQERIRDGRRLSRNNLLALEHLLSEASAAVQQNAALIESPDEIEARFWKFEVLRSAATAERAT